MKVRIKSENIYSKKKGDLIFQSYYDGESNINVQGMSIFFQEDGSKKIQYIKSIVMTTREARAVRRGRANIIQDIGYYLEIGNSHLRIHDFGTYGDCPNTEEGFTVNKVKTYAFSLVSDVNPLKDNPMVIRDDNTYGMYGYVLATSVCVSNYIDTEGICSSVLLDDSEEVMTYYDSYAMTK